MKGAPEFMKKQFKVFAKTKAQKRYVKSYSSIAERRRIIASTLDDNSPEHQALSNYLPPRGEGSTMASQISTAVFKLVYKWFNDGDVYDNSYYMEGWANDLSSYANWLFKYVPVTKSILERIYDCNSEDQYEGILADLMKAVSDTEDLENWYNQTKQGSVYDCRGPFKWIDLSEEEEDEYEDIPWGDEKDDEY